MGGVNGVAHVFIVASPEGVAGVEIVDPFALCFLSVSINVPLIKMHGLIGTHVV